MDVVVSLGLRTENSHQSFFHQNEKYSALRLPSRVWMEEDPGTQGGHPRGSVLVAARRPLTTRPGAFVTPGLSRLLVFFLRVDEEGIFIHFSGYLFSRT